MTPLRQRMTEDMQLRNLSPDTQRSYLHQISQLARYFKKSPDMLGPSEIRSYQLHLMQEKVLAPSSLLVAVSAIRFLYNVTLQRDCRARRPGLPVFDLKLETDSERFERGAIASS